MANDKGTGMSLEKVAARAQILIRKPRDEVFNAFIDPRIMNKFWFRRNDQGLREGQTMSWYVGESADAPEIEVHVKSIVPPSQIIIEWGQDNQFTTVTWALEEQNSDETRLVIEESGFTGSREEVVSQALDSTSGFNQVIVALKALLEHKAIINVVKDHI